MLLPTLPSLLGRIPSHAHTRTRTPAGGRGRASNHPPNHQPQISLSLVFFLADNGGRNRGVEEDEGPAGGA